METPAVPAPEKKDNRTLAIVGSIAAIVLCGLVGLCALCPLSITIFAGLVPDPASSYGEPLSWGFGLLPLCVSVIFIAIGVVVPILLLRKKKPAAETASTPSEPLPPAS